MNIHVHSSQEDELDYAYEDIKKCLSRINEKIENEILFGNCLESLEELRSQFKNMYQEIQTLHTTFSSDETLYKKKMLCEALDASIEFSIAYSLLEEEKKNSQFYYHMKTCIRHLQKVNFYIEDRFSVLKRKDIFQGEKVVSLSLMQLVCAFEEKLPAWQELFETEYRRLKNGGCLAERSEQFSATLVDTHIYLQKICETMSGTLAEVEGELDSHYRLHILFCYLEQQAKKVVENGKSSSLGSSSRSKQAQKLEMQIHRDLENVLSTCKSMPEAISRWKASKMRRKERIVHNESRHLRLVTS